MTVKDMHYDFKVKFNKIDSQQNRNLRIPEIDWYLNEAQELFVRSALNPKIPLPVGFESTQGSIDDLKSLVIEPYPYPFNAGSIPIVNQERLPLPVIRGIVKLPEKYLHFIHGLVVIERRGCEETIGELVIRRHIEPLFDKVEKSSYEWREISGFFTSEGIMIQSDETFTPTKVFLTYIKRPDIIHNAEDFGPNGYKLPSGVQLTGHADCKLPIETHKGIVSLAVALASFDAQTNNTQNALLKLKMNHIQ